jgi:four helix bundle protein
VPESAKVKHYKELKIWQKSMALATAIYRLTAKFPADERYGLVSQMRRAAVSIPSNVAEGQARHGTREFLQFLSHASGSLGELETQTLLAVNLGYCASSDVKDFLEEIAELQKMIAAIRRKLAVF